jgi:putative ubiquitin-RnfH superfamily antitoxin RatB of RatAB toxin-antitoxin module
MINIEVFISANQFFRLEVAENLTLEDLIKDYLQEYDIDKMKVGVFSQEKDKDYVLKDNDRVEFYKPLLQDPKQLRLKKLII